MNHSPALSQRTMRPVDEAHEQRKVIDKSRYGEGLACMDMTPRLLNVAYPEYPVAAGATACLGQFEVSVVAYAGRKVVVDVDGVD